VTESKAQPLLANDTEQLLRAAADGNAEAVKAFLAAGANVNGSNDNQQTALIRAAFFGHGEVVRALLAAGADLHTKDKLGFTALDWSCARGFPEVAQLLRAASPEMAITREVLPQPEPSTGELLAEGEAVSERRSEPATQPLHFTAAFTRAMRDARIAESSAQLLDEPQVEANEQDDQLPGETLTQTMSGETSQRLAEPATQRLDEAATEPLAEVPGQAQVGESPTEPLSYTAALKRELHREKQLADTAQDLVTESPSQTGLADAGEPYNQLVLVDTGTELPDDETPTRPLSQFSAELLDDAPTQSLSELFAEAELRETMGKAKLGDPSPANKLGEEGALPPRVVETSYPLDSAVAIKQCPVCHKIYQPTETYCAHDAARLVQGPVAPESELPSGAAPRKGHAFLWVMMTVLALAGIPVAYLLMSKRPAEPPPATTVPSQTKVVEPTVEPTEVKRSPIVEGAIKGSEISVPEPEYPEAARNQGISGSITVAIIVSRGGKVVSARTSAGPELLRNAAKAAARKALFTSQQGTQRSGSITYYFGKMSSGLVPEISIPHPGKRTETPEIVQYPLVNGEIKGSEIIVPEAEYPAAAKRRWLSGLITVAVTVSSEGKVIAARSSKGSQLLRSAAESAARKALFKPQPGPPRSGTITYHLGPLGQS